MKQTSGNLLLLMLGLVGLVGIEADAQSTNTTVRFRFAYGSHGFANVEVELFDHDKPATVANFLGYVRRGDYDNSILHECIPGRLLRGGLATLANPFSSAPFEQVSGIPSVAPIPNESSHGPALSNLFGTLAMSLPSGSNSARSSWFFNLGNNTNLDQSGFTVFGKVTAGREVLRFFNTVTDGNGLQNYENGFQRTFCPPISVVTNGVDTGLDVVFPSFPVGFYGVDCLAYADVFNVEIVELDGMPLRRPRVTITGLVPAVEGSAVTVMGTASDNESVALVRAYLNTAVPRIADGTNAWSVTLNNLIPGTNAIVVEAIDNDGLSVQALRLFFRSVTSPLTLATNGSGSGAILGLTNGQPLEIGRGYQITAKPDVGSLFGGWTGSAVSENNPLNFIARSNTTLTALFATNAFPLVNGTYSGLFFRPDQVEQRSSGFLNLTLSAMGSYSARLSMNGQTHRFSGNFAVDGKETNIVNRLEGSPLFVRLAADFAGDTDGLTGSVVEAVQGGWSAELVAHRPTFDAINNPAPQAGRYTMMIPLEDFSGPGGDSVGLVTVTPAGAITFQGLLADGTKTTQRTILSKNGLWPLYLPLYGGKGAMVSAVQFTNELASDFVGSLHWFKQSHSARYYRNGFTNASVILGSTYSPPLFPDSVLNFTDATIGFTNGNLIANFANDVILTNNRVLNLSPNKLTMKITKTSGLFSGSVLPLGNIRNSAYSGVVFQKQNVGAGFILGTNQSGRLLFQAD